VEAGRAELFHRLDEDSSARVRRWITEHGLTDRVRFRNILYPEAKAAFEAHGGEWTPALWVDGQLFSGTELVLARLEAMLDLGRSD
jgi:hypothetical protein